MSDVSRVRLCMECDFKNGDFCGAGIGAEQPLKQFRSICLGSMWVAKTNRAHVDPKSLLTKLHDVGSDLTDIAAERIRGLTAALDRAEADKAAAVEALETLFDAITATDHVGDRKLTITGSTANLRWLLDAEENAQLILAAAIRAQDPQ